LTCGQSKLKGEHAKQAASPDPDARIRASPRKEDIWTADLKPGSDDETSTEALDADLALPDGAIVILVQKPGQSWWSLIYPFGF